MLPVLRMMPLAKPTMSVPPLKVPAATSAPVKTAFETVTPPPAPTRVSARVSAVMPVVMFCV